MLDRLLEFTGALRRAGIAIAVSEEIDALKAIPQEELLNPLPSNVEENEPTPHSTDAIGTEKWDRPASEETLDS